MRTLLQAVTLLMGFLGVLAVTATGLLLAMSIPWFDRQIALTLLGVVVALGALIVGTAVCVLRFLERRNASEPRARAHSSCR